MVQMCHVVHGIKAGHSGTLGQESHPKWHDHISKGTFGKVGCGVLQSRQEQYSIQTQPIV